MARPAAVASIGRPCGRLLRQAPHTGYDPYSFHEVEDESFFQMVSNRIVSWERGRGRYRRGAGETPTEQATTAGDAADARTQKELAIYQKFYRKYMDVRGMSVVAQEEVLGDSSSGKFGGSPVIRVFADAFHQVAGTRPVVPDDRGNQYRNDLAGGAREFIVVDAERGMRERAFDHEAVARQMGGDADAAKLLVDGLQFSADGATVTLSGPIKEWILDLKTGNTSSTPTAGWMHRRSTPGNELQGASQSHPSGLGARHRTTPPRTSNHGRARAGHEAVKMDSARLPPAAG